MILLADHPFYGGYGGAFNGRAQMEQLAHDTGGRVIDVGNNGRKLEDAFDQIQGRVASTQYLASYTPDNKTADGKFRKVKLPTAARGSAGHGTAWLLRHRRQGDNLERQLGPVGLRLHSS